MLEKVPRKFMSVLITGGNSGIGEQLALKYASVRFFLKTQLIKMF